MGHKGMRGGRPNAKAIQLPLRLAFSAIGLVSGLTIALALFAPKALDPTLGRALPSLLGACILGSILYAWACLKSHFSPASRWIAAGFAFKIGALAIPASAHLQEVICELAFAASLCVALFRLSDSRERKFWVARLFSDGIVGILALIAFGWFLHLQPLLQRIEAWNTVNVLHVIQGVVEVGFFIGALVIGLQSRSAELRPARRLLIASMFFCMAHSMLHSLHMDAGSVGLYDSTIVVANAIMLFFAAHAAVRSSVRNVSSQERGPLRRRLPSSLLFLFVPTSFAWSGVVFAATGISVDLFVAIFCSITLMTAVMIRQVILIRDNRALEAEYQTALADLREKSGKIHQVSNQLVDRNMELESMQAELKNTILELERQRSVAIKNSEKAKHANEELRYMQLGLLDHLRKAESANKELEEVKAELMATNESMADANRMLLLASQTDGLTGLPNHRSIHESLADEMEWAQSKGDPVTLCLFDVDHFKSFNDTFGHLAGDDCLRLLAKTVREVLRGGDILGRYGGEEFAVIFRRTSLAQAVFVAERIRSHIESTDFGHRKVTVSLGLASSDEAFGGANELIQAADEALYAAKRGGRNRTSIHMPDQDRKAA